MAARTRAKNSRQRGSHTHGYGSMKKHRGAGSRGGRGNAGSGKRGDSQKPKAITWDRPARKGFTSKCRIDIKPVTIAYLENHLEKLVEQKLIENQAGVYVVDLKKMGYDKLLSNGNAKNKFKIIGNLFSEKAKQKIEAAGGQIGDTAPAKEE